MILKSARGSVSIHQKVICLERRNVLFGLKLRNCIANCKNKLGLIASPNLMLNYDVISKSLIRRTKSAGLSN